MVSTERLLNVQVPKGHSAGPKSAVAGQGARHQARGGTPGDVFIEA